MAEEVERLERDLEKKTTETEELRSAQTRFLEEIKSQDKLNKSLKEEAMLQKQSYEELESNLNTKNELVSPCFTLLWLYSFEIENSLSLGLKTKLLGHKMGKVWFNKFVQKVLQVVGNCELCEMAPQKTNTILGCIMWSWYPKQEDGEAPHYEESDCP